MNKILKISIYIIVILTLNSCKDGKNKELILALPVADWWTSAPFIITQSDSIFKANGLSIKILEVNSGLASKNAVVAGTADIGITAATPLALAASNQETLTVLGTYLKSKSVVGIVLPIRDTALMTPPTPIAIVPSTISEWYLYKYLESKNIQNILIDRKLKLLPSRPSDIPGAITSGSANSAVVWEPFLSLIALQPNMTIDKLDIGFEVNLYLIARNNIVIENEETIKTYLKCIKQICDYLNKSPEDSQHQVEMHFGFKKDFLSSTWGKVNYKINQDTNSMRIEIMRDSEIAKSLGYIKNIPEFNYFFEPYLNKKK